MIQLDVLTDFHTSSNTRLSYEYFEYILAAKKGRLLWPLIISSTSTGWKDLPVTGLPFKARGDNRLNTLTIYSRRNGQLIQDTGSRNTPDNSRTETVLELFFFFVLTGREKTYTCFNHYQ